jgi:DegV family protein with EDD domain
VSGSVHRGEDDIKVDLENEILSAVKNGYTTFITGMSRGPEIWAGNTVVRLKSRFPELKLIAGRIVELIKNSELFEDICKKIAEYQTRTRLMFCLESLKNLANNGRVSPVVARIAGVLGIRAVGKASDEGTLEMLDKVRGEKGAVAKIFERMQEMGYRGGKVLIDNCCNLPAAKQLQALILDKFPKAQIIHDTCKGLCSFYAEKGGLMIGFECY